MEMFLLVIVLVLQFVMFVVVLGLYSRKSAPAPPASSPNAVPYGKWVRLKVSAEVTELNALASALQKAGFLGCTRDRVFEGPVTHVLQVQVICDPNLPTDYAGRIEKLMALASEHKVSVISSAI